MQACIRNHLLVKISTKMRVNQQGRDLCMDSSDNWQGSRTKDRLLTELHPHFTPCVNRFLSRNHVLGGTSANYCLYLMPTNLCEVD